MGILRGIRLFPPETVAPPRPPALAGVAAGSELGEADLEAVVGGLERVFVPD